VLKEKFTAIIIKYVPESAMAYCVELWDRYRFSFKVSRERKSKLGDYRFHKQKKVHVITVNGSLNPYGFLITYIHEVAHLVHFELSGINQPPHGKIWKRIFRELMIPTLIPEIFPEDLLLHLKKHMRNPKASSCSDPQLARIIKKYDGERPLHEQFLEEIDPGEMFRLNGNTYEKMEKRRTRSLCRDIKNGKRYLISEMAMVKKI